jgi:hypothetical protein
MTKDKEGYNGWKNRETWNVALWIQNDEGLYELARDCKDYAEFREIIRSDNELGGGTGAIAYETPDQVAWNDSGLDIPRLDELIKELRG